MEVIMGDFIVLAVLGIIVALAVRSLYLDRKKGGCAGCSHNCGSCNSACSYSKLQ